MIRDVILVLAILLVGVVPAQAFDAQGAGRGIVAGPVGAHPVDHRSLNHHSLNHHSLNRHPFIPFGGIAVYAPPVLYVPYASYDPAPVYVSPAMYSEPAGSTVSIVSASPPMPSVIPYPTGRYELRGDGFTSPYQWAWIPNPPAAPPTAPPVGAPAPSAPESGDAMPSPRSQLYRWIDDEGVVHWTQGWDSIPEQYRAHVTRRRSS